MKTTSQKKKKKGSKKTKRSRSNPKANTRIKTASVASAGAVTEAMPKEPVVAPKKVPEKKREDKGSGFGLFNKVSQFLREAKMELKKVKWPTRKELMASTAMVIFLVLLVALYLGLIDFGLIKALKLIVG